MRRYANDGLLVAHFTRAADLPLDSSHRAIAERAAAEILPASFTSFSSLSDETKGNIAEECVAFLDQILRSINLSLDTRVSGFEVGVQMSYDDRQSFVGQRTGSTQFQLMLWGQLQFSAGMIPRRLPGL